MIRTIFPYLHWRKNLKACDILPSPRLVKESRKTSKSLKDVPAPHRPSLSINAYDRLWVIKCSTLFNKYLTNSFSMHPFSNPWKHFQGVEKGCIRNEWINITWNMSSTILYHTKKHWNSEKPRPTRKSLQNKDNFCTNLPCEILTDCSPGFFWGTLATCSDVFNSEISYVIIWHDNNIYIPLLIYSNDTENITKILDRNTVTG